MSDNEFQTKTVSRGVAISDPIRLSQTANTKVGFIPTLHGGGVRGHLVKYKKKSSKAWKDLTESDFSSHALASMQKVTIQLDTEATTKLIEKLNALGSITKHGIHDGQKDYVVAEKGKAIVIDDENKLNILRQILDDGHTDEYWKLIAENQPDLAAKLASGHILQVRSKIITELKKRLTEQHSETAGPTSWQRWIFDNSWLFGANYQKPIEKQKINISGVMPDYLFPRIDGFVDVLEIKLPCETVLVEDSSHLGAYRWSAPTSAAIGQVASYLTEIERQQLEIERQIYQKYNRNVSMLKPRAYILIGDSTGWPQQQRDGLRKLNNHLHGIEILTYQELINRGQAFLSDENDEIAFEADEDIIPF